MEDKQINRWLRRQFSPVGWLLLAYYGLMNVMVMAVMLLDIAVQFGDFLLTGGGSFLPDSTKLMSNGWGYILAAAVAMVILYAWKGGQCAGENLFHKEKRMTAPVFFCLLTLAAGGQLPNSLWISFLEVIANLFGRSVLELMESVTGDADTFSMFLYSAIAAPAAEELLFRGYLLRKLKPFGRRFAIFSSAFLFALFHGNLLQAPYAFLAGLVLGYTAMEYSLFWAIGIHIFNNLVLADLLTRVMELLPMQAADLLALAVFGGFTLASAGILLANRQGIREYRQAERMDGRCLKQFFLSPGILVLMVFMAFNMLSMLVM